MKESLGVVHDDWVPNERYEKSEALNANMKAYALEFAESDFERQMVDRHWPFDDQDEQERYLYLPESILAVCESASEPSAPPPSACRPLACPWPLRLTSASMRFTME